MHNIKNLKEGRLLDPWRFMGAKRRKALDESWAGIFRKHALPNLPVIEFSKNYCMDNGRPSTELRAGLGLLALQQMHDTTDDETLEEFMFDEQWHYALDITDESDAAKYMCSKTLWSLRNTALTSGMDKKIFEAVMESLRDAFSVNMSKQRLDSKHVESNMKRLGRLGILTRSIFMFLAELKRRAPNKYAAVGAKIVKRYEAGDEWSCFSMVKPSESAKKLGEVCVEMHELVEQFRGDAEVCGFESYAVMSRVFAEQCEVKHGAGEGGDEKVAVFMKPPKEVSSSSVQNPSDPDAGYDAHKGRGYKVQIMETYCDDPEKKETELNLITHVAVSAANEHDTHALAPAIEDAAERGLKPEIILADSHYGSDENVEAAAEAGVAVVSRVMGETQREYGLEDFSINDNGAIEQCPMSIAPVKTKRNKKRIAMFDAAKCEACEKRSECPVERGEKYFYLRYDEKTLRTARRRASEKMESFKSAYRMRSGIESTMSQYDRRTGVGRLRIRGLRRVGFCSALKASGVNIIRATAVAAARAKKSAEFAANSVKNALESVRSKIVSSLLHTYSTIFYMRPKIRPAA